MTGYSRVEDYINGKKILIEIRCLNYRYIDFSVRISTGYAFLEEKLKKYFKNVIKRGKIDVFLKIEDLRPESLEITINEAFTDAYIETLKTLGDKYELSNDISISSVAKCKDIFSVSQIYEKEENIWSELEPLLKLLTENLLEMKTTEGKEIKSDISSRVKYILSLLKEIEEISKKSVDSYKVKLESKIKEILGDINIDEQRVLTEVAILADRADISEEITRLNSHLKQIKQVIDISDTAIGKKFDFIIQEMNREINTIGSKSSDFDISRIVVELKSEVEKIREQIQNIE